MRTVHSSLYSGNLCLEGSPWQRPPPPERNTGPGSQTGSDIIQTSRGQNDWHTPVKQECIPVGCIPSAAVAISPATHAPHHAHPPPHMSLKCMSPTMQSPAMHTPCQECLPPRTHPPPHTPPPTCMPPTTHVPCHACLLPCIPPATLTPCGQNYRCL